MIVYVESNFLQEEHESCLELLRLSESGDICLMLPAFSIGEPRQKSTSHRIYRTPWIGDPRVNIQNAKGMAKPYQVRQVIKAIEKLENMQ